MTDAVESAKEAAGESAKDAPKPVRPRIKLADAKQRPAEVASRIPEISKPAPIAAQAEPPGPKAPAKPALWKDTRAIAAATVGIVVGTAFGMVATPRGSNAGLAEMAATLEASRAESARLNSEVELIAKGLAGIREASDAARGDGRSLATGVTERMTQLEQRVVKSVTTLGDRMDQADRHQSDRIAALTAQVEKRNATTAPIAQAAPLPLPAAAITPAAKADVSAPAKSEPDQTGSVGDAKPKLETIDSWAVREVFEGVALLENRRRRLIEVVPGGTVPGVGRVEAIEKRGRSWVVVTKQGLITSQIW